MNLYKKERVACGILAAIMAVSFTRPLTANELDTEIPSAGAAVVIEEYLAASGTEKELAGFVPAQSDAKTNVTAKKEPEKTTQNNKTNNEFKSKTEELFSDIAIATVSGGSEDYVNVRKKANANSKKVGKIYNNCGARILETTKSGWYKIVSGNCTGYVKAEFFVIGDDARNIALDNGYVFANIKDSGIRVRENNSTDSAIVRNVYHNERYVIKKFDKAGEWAKVKIEAGVNGWISTQYVKLSIDMDTAITLKEEKEMLRRQREEEERLAQLAQQPEPTNNTNTNTNNNTNTNTNTTKPSTTYTYTGGSSSKGAAVVAYAKQFLGNPYVYGGSSLTNGTDCSGFTMSVYAHFGYSLNRTSYTQAYNGTSVSMSSLKPGDLLFYNNGGSTISHVAIYAGGGQIIHASTSTTGIIMGSVGSPCAARRIIN